MFCENVKEREHTLPADKAFTAEIQVWDCEIHLKKGDKMQDQQDEVC